MVEIVAEKSVEANRTLINIRYKNYDKYKTSGDLGYNAIVATARLKSDVKIEKFTAEVPETMGGDVKHDTECALEQLATKMQDRLKELRNRAKNRGTLEEAAEDALTKERVQHIDTMMVEIENVCL